MLLARLVASGRIVKIVQKDGAYLNISFGNVSVWCHKSSLEILQEKS